MAGVRRRKPEWTVGWKIFAVPAIPFAASLVRLDIRDGHKMPATGPIIVTPNHYSNADPIAVGYALWKLGRAPRFLTKASLFEIPVFGAILNALGLIPVERGTSSSASPLATASDLAEKGIAVVIYPEGTLTRDPDEWPMRGKTGAVRAALTEGVPIIPMGQWGAQQIMGRYEKRPHLGRKTVTIIVGDPVDLSPWQGKPLTALVVAEATAAVMAAITALVEQLRDEKAPLERWDPAQHGQTEFGTL